MKQQVVLGAVAGLALAFEAGAFQVTMDTFNGGSSGNYRANPSADFEWVLGAYAPGATDGTWFGTFCLEKNEYFTPGSTYDVSLSSAAHSGGVSGGVNGADPISNATAYLYEKFALGILQGFNYGTAASGLELQNAIWWLEGELDAKPSGNKFITLVEGLAGQDATIGSDYSGSAVQVMTLTDRYGNHQDQLVRVSVPDGGATVMLLGLGLLGCVASGRRNQK